MKGYLKTTTLILVLVMALSLAGCGGKGASTTQEGTAGKEEQTAGPAASEEYFEWDGNLISALTESGMNQTEIVIPKRCTGFSGEIFSSDECKVKSVSFESNSDFNLNSGFRRSASLEEIKLPSGLTQISDMEFWCCSALKEITIPAGVTDIGQYTFQDCRNLETVVFEGDLTEIKPNTFNFCRSLNKIVLPDTVTKIDEYAFSGCSSLKEITLPTGLTEMGISALANNGVEKVIVPPEVTLEKWDYSSFIQSEHDVEVYVTEGSWMDQNFKSVFDGAFNKHYTE